MIELRIYSDPRAHGVELHSKKVGPTNDERKFTVVEKGKIISDDFEIPKDANIKDYIQGFFAGCAYMEGELRMSKRKN